MLSAGGPAQQPAPEADADPTGRGKQEENEQKLRGTPPIDSDAWEPGGSWWQVHQQGYIGRGGPDGKHALPTVAIDDRCDEQRGHHAADKKEQQRG